MEELLGLVDKDTDAFNRIMDVFAMPKGTEEEKVARAEALEKATEYACEVPLDTMRVSMSTFTVLGEMAEKGNPASVSDAGVGALAARAAVHGAGLNVRINAAGLKDRQLAERFIDEAAQIEAQADDAEKKIIEKVNAIISSK